MDRLEGLIETFISTSGGPRAPREQQQSTSPVVTFDNRSGVIGIPDVSPTNPSTVARRAFVPDDFDGLQVSPPHRKTLTISAGTRKRARCTLVRPRYGPTKVRRSKPVTRPRHLTSIAQVTGSTGRATFPPLSTSPKPLMIELSMLLRPTTPRGGSSWTCRPSRKTSSSATLSIQAGSVDPAGCGGRRTTPHCFTAVSCILDCCTCAKKR